MKNILTHADTDGIISAVIFLKASNAQKFKILFTSTPKVKANLCRLIAQSEKLENLNVFDISPTNLTLKLASVFKDVLWLDHHKTYEDLEVPPNVKLVIDDKQPSAAQVVANYFGIEDDELLEIANEVDTNQIKSEDARFIRDYIGAIKWKYRGKYVQNKLRNIVLTLLKKGIDMLGNEESAVELVERYREWCLQSVKDIEKKILIENVNGKKVAILETTNILPIYLISEKLKEHKQAPFDIIAFINHRLIKNKIITKVELRTHTDFVVYEIAKRLGGGGHEKASGASIEGLFTAADLIKNLQNYFA